MTQPLRYVARKHIIAAALGGALATAGAQAPATVRGVVVDSIRHGPLSGAAVDLMPRGRRVLTNDSGGFQFDSVEAGQGYQLRVAHPMLDTVGLTLATPVFAVAPGETKRFVLGVPSPAKLVTMFCPPGMIARGPSVLVGFVRDPDSGLPLDSAKVSLVYEDGPLGLVKHPINRESQLDASGRYKICGLPAQLTGKVQVIRKTAQSAEIPVTIGIESPVAMRGIGLSATTQQAAATDSVGRTIRLLRGAARLNGRVVTKSGAPVAGAHVQMASTTSVAITGPDGRFSLDSVPVGTQSINVRKLGYNSMDQAVDVEAGPPVAVSVVMENFVTTLPAIVTVGQRDKDLERVGFIRRRNQGFGIYREAADLPKTNRLGDALATLPGLIIGHANTGFGTKNVIQGSHGVGSCVTFVVDGILWKDPDETNSIEDFVRPDEVEAIELYSATTAPLEFVTTIQSNCQVLVIWTNRKIGRGSQGKKPPL